MRLALLSGSPASYEGPEQVQPTDIAPLAELLASGGDARIVIDRETGRNRYNASPLPTGLSSYASSTANDISAPAFEHLRDYAGRLMPDGFLPPAAYRAALYTLRARIRAAYGLPHSVAVMFAASGTDLEYLGLAQARRSGLGIANLLLGADEVGSGCIHSASGQYFAEQTPRGLPTRKGAAISDAVTGKVELRTLPVRDDGGRALTCSEITTMIDQAVTAAKATGLRSIVHVVHGSKTGLVMPSFDGIDMLAERHGDWLSFIVDACQARITSPAIAAYLQRGCTVMMTGSKFMGGPPFSGIALIPQAVIAGALPLPTGFDTIFRRGEWPAQWPGQAALPDEANPGLLLRLEAAVFELERFQRIPMQRVERVVLAFHAAVHDVLVTDLGARRLAPYAPGHGAEGNAHPVEMRTLSTLDLTSLSSSLDFDDAVSLHGCLIDYGVRLGQPVKCVRLSNGRWGATLRVGLSMPQIVTFDALDSDALQQHLTQDMRRIAEAIRAEGWG